MNSWPFENSPNTAVFTSRQVLEGAPILHVTHDADDGSWQFHSGGSVTSDDARIVGLGWICRQDPTLLELADLPEGWKADRARVGAPWQREAKPQTE
jgi:hypothetical protein